MTTSAAMTDTIAIGLPGERQSKPLHRTMPCWSRRIDKGLVRYSLLVPHRLGGGVQSIEHFAPDTPRTEVARVLRERRRMLWGRGKDGADTEVLAAPKKTHARKGATVQGEASPAVDALQADAAPAEVVAGIEAQTRAPEASPPADEDRPPWDEVDETSRAFAAEADAALEAAIRDTAPPVPEPENSTAVDEPEPETPAAAATAPPEAYRAPPRFHLEPDGQMGFTF